MGDDMADRDQEAASEQVVAAVALLKEHGYTVVAPPDPFMRSEQRCRLNIRRDQGRWLVPD